MKFIQLLLILCVSVLLACATAPAEEEATDRAMEPTIANCVEEELAEDGTATCVTCAENYAWNGTACAEAADGSVCLSGGESTRAITFMDETGNIHYICPSR